MVESLRDHVFWRRNYHPGGRIHHPRGGQAPGGLRGRRRHPDAGAARPPGGAQARRAGVQRPLQGPHARRTDDRGPGGLVRHHAVQPQQHRDGHLPGDHPAGDGGGRAARADDRLRSGNELGTSDLGWNHRELRGLLAGARPALSAGRRGRRGRRAGARAAGGDARTDPAPTSPRSRSGSCSTFPTAPRSTCGTRSGPRRLAPTSPARSAITRSPRSATRSTLGASRSSTAIRCRRAWCWSRRRRITPGRRSSGPWVSGPTSWCTCRWTPASGWTPTRYGRRCVALARPPAGDRRLRQRVREHRGERGGPARPGARGAQPRRAGAGSDLSSPLGRLLRRIRGGRDPIRGRPPARRVRHPSERGRGMAERRMGEGGRGARRGRFGKRRPSQARLRALLGGRGAGARRQGSTSRRHRSAVPGPERRRAARRRAVSRPVHPGGLQARRSRRRGVAQPQGAAAGRAGLRLSDRAHGRGGPAAAPLPGGRGLLALPGRSCCRSRTSTSSAISWPIRR